MVKSRYVLLSIVMVLLFGACSKEAQVNTSHSNDKALWQQFRSKNAVEQFDSETN